MDLQELNATCEPTTLLPLIKLRDLTVNQFYYVTNIYRANTKYGMKFLVSLGNTHSAFLSGKVSEYLDKKPQALESLLKEAKMNNLALQYMGDKPRDYVKFSYIVDKDIEKCLEFGDEGLDEFLKIKQKKLETPRKPLKMKA